MLIQSPCLYCQDRFVGCHDRCGLYKEYREEIEKQSERRRQAIREYELSFCKSQYDWFSSKIRKK